ncbi:MAG TPA: M24 family metallopeptidase, partial [Candidatus Bathyarchaeota archaeon]|nr:M24 family metallopeptidase [Candidatus Bathyarchaeota archaeon]
HSNGFIADTAITVNVSSEEDELITAVNEALANVERELEPNIRVSKISSIIERTITYYGF